MYQIEGKVVLNMVLSVLRDSFHLNDELFVIQIKFKLKDKSKAKLNF
mgnify:FL=1